MKKHCLTNCNHNLLHFLAVKVDGLWKINQYVKDAKKEKHHECAKLWLKVANHDKKMVNDLRNILISKCKKGKFK